MALLPHSGFAIVSAASLAGRKVSGHLLDRRDTVISRSSDHGCRLGVSCVVSIVIIVSTRLLLRLVSPSLVFVIRHVWCRSLEPDEAGATKLDKVNVAWRKAGTTSVVLLESSGPDKSEGSTLDGDRQLDDVDERDYKGWRLWQCFDK